PCAESPAACGAWPAAAPSAPPAASADAPRSAAPITMRSVMCAFLSPRLRDDVDERRFAALDDLDRLPERGTEIRRVLDGPDAEHPVRLGERRVVDVRIGKVVADADARDVALGARRHVGD